MSSKRFSWKKFLLAAVWTTVGASTIVLLVAAAQNQNGEVCKDVVVNIKTVDGVEYISKKQILQTISGGRPDLMKGQLVKTFDLQQLEELLEHNLWIRNAELFFDNNNVLHADITEREPVARVFREAGESFYVDDLGEQLPVTTDQIARVPVFTSFPNEAVATKQKDSVLQQQVKELGHYILKNDFWMAQVDQVNVNNYEFELIPKLGNHVILFGDGTNIEAKFSRLLLFYKKVMTKTGWNFYSALDVRYDKQLVAVRRDSASLFKSFVLQQSTYQKRITEDSTYSLPDSVNNAVSKPIGKDSIKNLLTSENNKSKPTAEPVLKSAAVKPQPKNPIALKNQLPTPSKTKAKTNSEEENVLNEAKQKTKNQPKAVMPKKGG
ncbi:MAG: hypothetical protein QM725_09575 [Lacibacter sp.]